MPLNYQFSEQGINYFCIYIKMAVLFFIFSAEGTGVGFSSLEWDIGRLLCGPFLSGIKITHIYLRICFFQKSVQSDERRPGRGIVGAALPAVPGQPLPKPWRPPMQGL